LKPAELKAALLNGTPARVVRVRTPQDDLMLLVISDLTGDLGRVDSARTALIEHVRQLPQSTWVGLMRAQDGLEVVLDPTPDRNKLAEAVQALPVTGNAGLLDSIETAVKLADDIAKKANVRIALLYLTDSDVKNYRQDFTNPVINSSDSRDLSRRFPEGLVRERVARLADSLVAHQTPVFIVHLSYAGDRLNQAYQTGLMQLASATGGSAAFCRSQADIAETVAATVRDVQNLYQVYVQAPPNSPRDITLTLDAAGRQVTHRSRFLIP
jgi:hypothetical protein